MVLLSWQRDTAEGWDMLSAMWLSFALPQQHFAAAVAWLVSHHLPHQCQPCPVPLHGTSSLPCGTLKVLYFTRLIKACCVLNCNHIFSEFILWAKSGHTLRWENTQYPRSYGRKSTLCDPLPSLSHPTPGGVKGLSSHSTRAPLLLTSHPYKSLLIFTTSCPGVPASPTMLCPLQPPTLLSHWGQNLCHATYGPQHLTSAPGICAA